MKDSVVWYYKYVLSTNANQGSLGSMARKPSFNYRFSGGPWNLSQNARFLLSTSKRHVVSNLSYSLSFYALHSRRVLHTCLGKVIRTKLAWHCRCHFEKSSEERILNESFNHLFFDLMNIWSVFFLIRNDLHQIFFQSIQGLIKKNTYILYSQKVTEFHKREIMLWFAISMIRWHLAEW